LNILFGTTKRGGEDLLSTKPGKKIWMGCSFLRMVGWKVEAVVPPFTPRQIAHALSMPLLPRQNHPCKVDWDIHTDQETSAFIDHLSWMLEGTP